MPTRKLKVGLVLDDTLDTNDGVQQYVLTLGEWLASRGHEVHYLVGETKNRQLPNIHSLSRNVATRYNRNRMSIPLPASHKKIKKLVNDQKFDILHVQMPYSPLLASPIILKAPSTTAIVGTFHILPYSIWVRYAIWLLIGLEWRSLRRFKKIFAVSPAAQNFIADTLKLGSEVVPNAVATARFAKAKRSFKPKNKVSIVFLGRLVQRKGCQVLLSAVNQLKTSGTKLPKFEVVICGAGPLMPKLIKYVQDNNLQNIVKFVGYVPETDKPARLASADIAVFPSNGGESFGIVLVEAMASGRAVVLAGRNPGYESVLGNQPELLFDSSDVDELAKKLQHYLLDKTLRRQHAAWCRQRAAEFDINRIGPVIESSYKQVASSKRLQHN